MIWTHKPGLSNATSVLFFDRWELHDEGTPCGHVTKITDRRYTCSNLPVHPKQHPSNREERTSLASAQREVERLYLKKRHEAQKLYAHTETA